jgi:outer membrane protein
MSGLRNLLILAGASLVASPTYAQNAPTIPVSELNENAAGVTLEEETRFIDAIQATYLNNPALRAARAELSAIQEQLPQAISGWMPNIEAEASVQATDVETSPDSQNDGSVAKALSASVEQPLYRGGKTSSETKAARHIIKSSIANLIAEEQEMLLQSITAYMNVVQNRALLELSENNQNVIARQNEATNDRFEVGELTRTDVQQAAARLASAEAQVITARGALRNSEAVFEELIGFRPSILNQPTRPLVLPASITDAALEAENSNPRVVAALSAHNAADYDIRGIYAELLPQISLRASVDKTYDPSPGTLHDQTNGAVGIFATIPLYSSGDVRSRVRQARHTANQRALEIKEVKRNARQEATQSWEDLITAKAEIKARQAQVAASLIARDGVKAEAEFGSRTVLDTLDADQELLDAQVALVTAERDQIVAEFSLLSVLGQLNPAQLGFSDDRVTYESYLENFKWDIFNMDVDRVQ